MSFRYTVRAEIGDPELAERFGAWLREGHVAEVCRAGGASAELLRIDGAVPTWEVRYAFPSRAAFDAYERDHAPRLRAEGLRLFPEGVRFARSTGELVASVR